MPRNRAGHAISKALYRVRREWRPRSLARNAFVVCWRDRKGAVREGCWLCRYANVAYAKNSRTATVPRQICAGFALAKRHAKRTVTPCCRPTQNAKRCERIGEWKVAAIIRRSVVAVNTVIRPANEPNTTARRKKCERKRSAARSTGSITITGLNTA